MIPVFEFLSDNLEKVTDLFDILIDDGSFFLRETLE